ncbi:DUF6515 family protein [Microbulbifer hydrolyticus]|uniref:Uncharacterized protein n=1 Tax=Microbulbifer hydrolyticus TaxID=48074 RepID=A0A6P1TEI3_9GAMM|nr:DUF6515 family protein [Microbulbifer hydrolyticus]MBB5213046.1 hypothetical protein [Microbulbifer hydrolyticus]QHQ40407.1 hypothetical protein GTQ55_16450 [Microbulbifer hydrolyticus]
MRHVPQFSCQFSYQALFRLLSVCLCGALLAFCFGATAQVTENSSAESQEDYQRDPNRQRTLPAGATRLTLSGNIYYYQGGYFYRKEDDGYLRVEPPLGAELTFIPYGSTGFDIDGRRFFLSGTGTFYRYEPGRRRYIVTTPPYEWRRYYNGDIVGSYEERLYGYPDENLDDLRDRSGIPRAYPPGALSPDELDGGGVPLFEADRDRGRRPYANVRPPYDASGERYDNRALAEAACRQDAMDAARRGSSLENQRLRIYQREYRDCIQRYDRRR